MYFSCIRSLHYLKDISDNLDSSQLYVGGYTIFFQGLHLTICLLRLRLSTLLRCNEMRLAGNLLSFCALYVSLISLPDPSDRSLLLNVRMCC